MPTWPACQLGCNLSTPFPLLTSLFAVTPLHPLQQRSFCSAPPSHPTALPGLCRHHWVPLLCTNICCPCFTLANIDGNMLVRGHYLHRRQKQGLACPGAHLGTPKHPVFGHLLPSGILQLVFHLTSLMTTNVYIALRKHRVSQDKHVGRTRCSSFWMSTRQDSQCTTTLEQISQPCPSSGEKQHEVG